MFIQVSEDIAFTIVILLILSIGTMIVEMAQSPERSDRLEYTIRGSAGKPLLWIMVVLIAFIALAQMWKAFSA